ncbi:MAG: 5-dehydro-2-deoxygluconokinase [Micrococcales bacterium]|nr:5-dehydro-2-deoxygluconokinase [Micrococcales bacterium]
MTAYDLVAMGRVGVDIYPQQHGVPLEAVQTFERFLGGSAANVTVAAARHGRQAALISRVAGDPFGRYLRTELARLRVDSTLVRVVQDGPPTPVTFYEIFPPDSFPVWFYRYPIAPDLLIEPMSLPRQAIREARVYWSTLTGLSQEPSRSAHMEAWTERGRAPLTVLDLDYRQMFWENAEAAREQISAALEHVTIAVGNRAECEIATGERDPVRAADALLERGVELAVVTQGSDGVFAATADQRVIAAAFPTRVVNGLGAGDAFGGALVHGLLEGWDLRRTIHFANVAGAMVAGRLECSTAMPMTAEVERLLADVVVTDDLV